jgi:uncharacterized protein involved in cysteine biosynthesis
MNTLPVGLLAAGVVGVLFVQVYLRACEWADWELMSSRVRRRVHACRRRAPAAVAGSGLLAGLGLVLVLVDGLT